MDPAAQEPNALFLPGIVVKAFKLFAMGAHIHEEYGAIKVIAGVFFGNDRFLDRIHAADRGTVRMVAAV